MRTTYTSEVFIAYFITLFSFGFLTPLFTILASSATIILAIYGFKRGLSSSKREKDHEKREQEQEKREQEQEKRNEIEHQNRVRIQELEILRLENEIGIDADDLAKRLKGKDDNP